MNHITQLQCADVARVESLAHHERIGTRSGVTIHWRRFGSAPGVPLVLLHGGHGSWAHWIRNVEALSADRTVWVPDMPGYGRSDSLPSDRDLDTLVASLLESVQLLIGTEGTFDLAAFSFGGLVASLLAGQCDVRRLVLLGSGSHGGPRRPHAPLRNWRDARDAASRTAMIEFNLYAFMLHERQADDLALCIHEDACLNTRFRSRSHAMPERLTTLLPATRAQKLLIWGACDVTLSDPWGVSASLKRHGIEHELKVVTDAGHWVQFERADAVNAIVRDWLA